MSVGTITANRQRITLATFETERGWVSEFLERTVEPLRTPGVDGSRLRIPRSQYPEFDATTIIGATDFPDAVATAKKIRAAVGTNVLLEVTGGGRTARWNNVLVHSAMPTVSAGPLVGDTTSSAHLVVVWRLELTEDEAGQ